MIKYLNFYFKPNNVLTLIFEMCILNIRSNMYIVYVNYAILHGIGR